MEKVKVLITGPVNGAISDLTLKLTSLQKSKAGPFDLCFCVGPFFSSSEKRESEIRSLLQVPKDNVQDDAHGNGNNDDHDDNNINNSSNSSNNSRMDIQLPLPVYFCDVGTLPKGLVLPTFHPPVDVQTDDAEISIEDVTQAEGKDTIPSSSCSNNSSSNSTKGIVSIAPNLYHLHGISVDQTQTADIVNISTTTSNHGNNYITVAFMPPKARMGSMQTATLESKTNHPSYVGCDLLLTSDWGQGMAASSCINSSQQVEKELHLLGGGLTNKHQSPLVAVVGSYDVAEVASQCRPRYHVAPSLCLQQKPLLSNTNGESSSTSSSSGGFFVQSLPYANPPCAMASGIRKNYHTSRFLALCPVVDAETQKTHGKSKKFIHALGIQPLWSMDRETATAVPENTVIAPFPYTDESYEMDRNNSQEERSRQRISSNNSGGGSSGGKVNGLSEAQARRILLEQQGGSGSGGGMQDYRWGVRNRKRPLEQDNNSVTQMASMDSTNCTLFLHGLHNDVTGGATLNRDALLNAFGSRGCIRVRYPVSDGYPSYCFLDFETHEDARRCLELNGGQEEILGIHLTMKWSAGKRRVGQQGHHHVVPPPLPPPPPGHVGIFNGGTSTKQQTKSRLREAEAIDSSSLFVHLDCPSMTEEIRSCALASVAGMAQKALEDAINADAGDDRVSADDEPALKVAVRPLQGRLNCGFLDFASHAAASMALATLTGSTDGGLVGTDAASSTISSDEKLSVIKEIQLWWARPKDTSSGKNVDSKGFRFHSHHFPLDARKDCWFCLASPTCEKHLIVSVLDYCYITMPKGPVNQNHALIVPVNHSANEGNNNISVIGAFLDPTPGAIADIERAKEKLRAYAREELNMDLFVFERAIPTRGGYHAHINCIPIEKGSGSKIIPTMLSLAASSNHGKGFELREIQNTDLSVTNILKNADEDELVGYFYAEVPFGVDGVVKRYLYMALDGEHMKDKKRQVPLQFGREVLAAVLGSDTLADWKVCLTSKEKEEEYTEAFRSSFAKFL